MKIIRFNDIAKLNIEPRLCYAWVSEALNLKKESYLPAKISLKPGVGMFYNTMPVLIPSISRGGVKLVTRYPDRNPSLQAQILLYDLNTGENVALMDGTWITTMRTGAVAAHSIKLFAKNDFYEMGFIGLGNTARATLQVLIDLFPDRPLYIKLKKYKNQHEIFAERFSHAKNVKFTFCDSIEEVVAQSDVIVSAATYFDGDLCPDEYFKEGVLLVPVHTRGFTNCDLFFDKIFADDTAHVSSFKNFNRFKSFAEVSDVISGKSAGRENNRERIIAYNIGIALHDIYIASKIYDICKDNCLSVSMDIPKDKFWL